MLFSVAFWNVVNCLLCSVDLTASMKLALANKLSPQGSLLLLNRSIAARSELPFSLDSCIAIVEAGVNMASLRWSQDISPSNWEFGAILKKKKPNLS